MYKRKNIKVMMIGCVVLFLVAIIALVYAAFTGQLNITGTAVNRKSNWDIHFENLSSITTTGSAKVLNQPTLNGTTSIEDYSVSTTSPGDTISFTFKVVNEGNYNASISSVSVSTPTCSGTDTTSNNNVCSRLSYTLTYDNGATVQVGDELYAKDYVTMKVTLTYAEFSDPSLLATEDVSISNLGITINYAQSDSAEVGDNGEVADYKVYHQGEKITLNNEDYYVIANSGAGQDYVVALKDLPLTVSEVNLYGGVGTENNHVNRYTNSSVGTAVNHGGYGGVAYYSSDTCGYIGGSLETTGCTSNYENSDFKYVVDAWMVDKFQYSDLKEINGYKARLITVSEYQSLPVNSSWKNSLLYGYRTMTLYSNTAVNDIRYKSGIDYRVVYNHEFVVRPIINVYKSKITS